MATFNFGERQTVESLGRGIQLSADGYPKAKPGGAEFKWSSVAALAADTYLTDQLRYLSQQTYDGAGEPYTPTATALDDSDSSGAVNISGSVKVPAGYKVLRYGTPIQRDPADGKFVLALTGGAVGKGDLFLVNETVIFNPAVSATAQIDPKSLFPIAIDGGRVWKDRIVHSTNANIGVRADTGAAVGSGVTVTLAQIEAALPGITYAAD